MSDTVSDELHYLRAFVAAFREADHSFFLMDHMDDEIEAHDEPDEQQRGMYYGMIELLGILDERSPDSRWTPQPGVSA